MQDTDFGHDWVPGLIRAWSLLISLPSSCWLYSERFFTYCGRETTSSSRFVAYLPSDPRRKGTSSLTITEVLEWCFFFGWLGLKSTTLVWITVPGRRTPLIGRSSSRVHWNHTDKRGEGIRQGKLKCGLQEEWGMDSRQNQQMSMVPFLSWLYQKFPSTFSEALGDRIDRFSKYKYRPARQIWISGK